MASPVDGTYQATGIILTDGGNMRVRPNANVDFAPGSTLTVNGGVGVNTASLPLVTDTNNSIDQLGITTSTTIGGTGVPGSAGTEYRITKIVTAIANNTATPILTVTVPNSSQTARIALGLLAVEGAGGAVGAGEAADIASGAIVVTRTAGVAAVITAATLASTAAAHVAGGDSGMTLAYSVSAVSGANSATQTFTVNVTIAVGGGSATNHTCEVSVELLNLNGTGITIA